MFRRFHPGDHVMVRISGLSAGAAFVPESFGLADADIIEITRNIPKQYSIELHRSYAGVKQFVVEADRVVRHARPKPSHFGLMDGTLTRFETFVINVQTIFLAFVLFAWFAHYAGGFRMEGDMATSALWASAVGSVIALLQMRRKESRWFGGLYLVPNLISALLLTRSLN